MAKIKNLHSCSTCGATSPQWSGKCPGCGDWNTMVEVGGATSAAVGNSPVKLTVVGAEASAAKWATGLTELDRVLGGGVTRGSVTLLGGEPGIGKSTLALQLAASARSCIYVSGEESVQQVAERARRLRLDAGELLLLQETDVSRVVATAQQNAPQLVIVDSIQTVAVPSVESGAGTVAQVRASASELVALAKNHDIAVVIIGHVTKEGALAGPRTLEHVVDTVLEFEGDRHHGLRLLRAVKHRFGATDEVGVLEMTETGMAAVTDPSGMFLDDRRAGGSGSIVVPALQGKRPVLVELQSLVVPGNPNQCRRVAQGLASARLAVVLAVMQKRGNINCTLDDVYASVVGGIKLDEPATDLPLALAIASSKQDRVIPDDVIAFGELGLGGEVRRVSSMPKRLTEAARMGFRRAIVPAGCSAQVPGIALVPVETVDQAMREIHRPATEGSARLKAVTGS